MPSRDDFLPVQVLGGVEQPVIVVHFVKFQIQEGLFRQCPGFVQRHDRVASPMVDHRRDVDRRGRALGEFGQEQRRREQDLFAHPPRVAGAKQRGHQAAQTGTDHRPVVALSQIAEQSLHALRQVAAEIRGQHLRENAAQQHRLIALAAALQTVD